MAVGMTLGNTNFTSNLIKHKNSESQDNVPLIASLCIFPIIQAGYIWTAKIWMTTGWQYSGFPIALLPSAISHLDCCNLDRSHIFRMDKPRVEFTCFLHVLLMNASSKLIFGSVVSLWLLAFHCLQHTFQALKTFHI